MAQSAPAPADTTAPDGKAGTQVPPAPELGFNGPIAAAFALGLGLLVLSGLFHSIIATSDDPGEGLVDTTVWFAWVAGVLVSASIIAAGYFGKAAPPGARIALLLVGTYLFITISSGGGSFLTGLFGRF